MAGTLESKLKISGRGLSVAVFSLYFSWLLAFLFEGRVFYGLAADYGVQAEPFVFGTMTAHFAGLILCGFFIKTMAAAKKLLLGSIAFCVPASFVFFFSPSFLWTGALAASSFLSGASVAAWGFFFRALTPVNSRLKTAADGLIGANVLMLLLNLSAACISPRIGLALSVLMLAAAFLFALRLPDTGPEPEAPAPAGTSSAAGALAFLCLFILIITINSGLMYQVQGPAYAHLDWLASWYWALPYIAALLLMRNLPGKINRAYLLYVAIAMIGFSFILFMLTDRSPLSYLGVDTLMLGACGIYDLFWWSILGEMLEYGKNPAKILGIGLSANVLGVLLGGLVGNAVSSAGGRAENPVLLALAVVCVTLAMLPLLHKRLSDLLKNHAYLTALSEMTPQEQTRLIRDFTLSEKLTGRESEIAALLLTGKTYRMIAGELHLSENTVKTHVKNIYAKTGVQSRTELMNLAMEDKLTL